MISVGYINSTKDATSFRMKSMIGKKSSSSHQSGVSCENKVRVKTAVRVHRRSKPKPSFPLMLHQILEDSANGLNPNVVGWEDDGASFHIFEPHVFKDVILPKYSKKKTKIKFRSFQRQLNIYGFKMTKKSGVYRHRLFRRGQIDTIAGIRPRPNGPKKSGRNQNDDDDESKSSNCPHLVTPSIGNCDDEGFGYQADMTMGTKGIVTIPLLSSNAFNRMISTNEEDGFHNTGIHHIHDDTISFRHNSSSCVSTQDDVQSPIGNVESKISLEQLQHPYVTATKDDPNLSHNPTICTVITRGIDFDLFDDIDDIELCNCEGVGCHFGK